MTLYNPAYRLTVYSPRSVDPTETTVMTPAAGAPHSDYFAVSTIDGLRPNLITNPELAVSTDGWTVNAGSGVRDSTIALATGSFSYKVTTTNVGGSGPIIYGSGTNTRYVVTAGQTMTYSMFIYAPAGAVGKLFHLVPHYYITGDTGGGSPDASGVSTTVALTLGWNRLTFTHTVPASMTRGLLVCYTDGAQGVFDIYAAGAQVEVATSVGLYNKYPFSFKPYLDLPRGRKGRFDAMKGKYDVPQMSFTLFDPKVTGYSDNLHRWVTAYIGNAEGKFKFIGRRIEVEESLDGGTLWTPFFAGRITDFSLDGPQKFTLSCREAAAELNQTLFENAAIWESASVANVQLLPVGITSDYGIIKAATPSLSGTLQQSPNYIPILGGSIPVGTNPNVYVFTVKDSDLSLQDNMGTQQLASLLGAGRFHKKVQNSQNNISIDSLKTDVPIQLKLSNSNQWLTYRLVAASYGGDGFTNGHLSTNNERLDQSYSISEVYFTAEPTNSVYYSPLSSLTTGTTSYQLRILPPIKSGADDTTPILVKPSHPAKVLEEALLGYYSLRNDNGTIGRAVPYKATASYAGDTENIAALLKDGSFPSMSLVVKKPITLTKFLEEVISPFGIGYRFEPMTVSGSIKSVFVPFDNRIPNTLPSTTIDNDALAHATDVQWSVKAPIPYLKVKGYVDVGLQHIKPRSNSAKVSTMPDVNPSKITTGEFTYFQSSDFSSEQVDAFDAGSSPLSINSIGLRAQQNSPDVDISDELTAYEQSYTNNFQLFDSTIGRIMSFYATRFMGGTADITVKCRRTDTINDLRVGNFVLVDVDVLPDPTSHLRGGVRLVQVTEKSEDLLTVTLGLSDVGRNVRLTAPLLGVTSGSGFYTTHQPITLATGSVRLMMDIAVMSAGAALPDHTSSYWRNQVSTVVTSSGAFTQSIYAGRANSTTWVRARVEPAQGNTNYLLPSEYVYSATGYTSPTVSPITGLTKVIDGPWFTLSWTGSANQVTTLVEVTAPTGSTATIVRQLPAATTNQYIGPYLAAKNPVRVSLYATDGRGGYSTANTIEFYTSSSISAGLGAIEAPLNVAFIDNLA